MPASSLMNHPNWRYSNDWYISGTVSSPYSPYGSNPYLGTYRIYQVFFDRITKTFTHHELLSQDGAGFWGGGDYNYGCLPSPTISANGQMIIYQRYRGKILKNR